jgi:hypothetical protein
MNYNSGAYDQSLNFAGITVGNYSVGSYNSQLPYDGVNLPLLNSKPLDIYIDQGDEFLKSVTILDTLGNKVNLSGFEARMVLSRYENVIQVESVYAVIVEPKTGLIVLNIPTSVTTLLTNPRYVYSVFIENSGTIVKVLHGAALITNR